MQAMKDALTILLLFALPIIASSDNVGLVLAVLAGCGALQYGKIKKLCVSRIEKSSIGGCGRRIGS